MPRVVHFWTQFCTPSRIRLNLISSKNFRTKFHFRGRKEGRLLSGWVPIGRDACLAVLWQGQPLIQGRCLIDALQQYKRRISYCAWPSYLCIQLDCSTQVDRMYLGIYHIYFLSHFVYRNSHQHSVIWKWKYHSKHMKPCTMYLQTLKKVWVCIWSINSCQRDNSYVVLRYRIR